MKTDLAKAQEALKKLDLFVGTKVDKEGKISFKKGEEAPISADRFLKWESDFDKWEQEHFKTIQDDDLDEAELRELAELYRGAVEARDRLRQLMADRPYTAII